MPENQVVVLKEKGVQKVGNKSIILKDSGPLSNTGLPVSKHPQYLFPFLSKRSRVAI